MANMASVAYAIEGPEGTLQKINRAIIKATKNTDDKRWSEYIVCDYLGIPYDEDKTSLGGEINDFEISDGVLRIFAEERWGLQDFNTLLEQKFPDIKVYWIVEESGCVVYATNDKEGKYFPDRFYVDTCINGNYQADYLTKEEDVFKWLSKLTNGKVTTFEDVDTFNEEAEDRGDEDFISIHEYAVME